MPRATDAIIVLGLGALLFCAGCGRDADEPAPPDAGTATDAGDDWTPVSDLAGGPKTDFADPEALTHPQGRFRVRWPADCVNVRSRLQESETAPGGYEMVSSTGHVDDDPGSGYTVWVWYSEPDGAAATPETVVERVSAVIGERDLTIVNQRAVQRLGMEGLVVYCREEASGLIFWIEGYLSQGRSLLVGAWRRDETMFEDPEILRFFRSVEFVD